MTGSGATSAATPRDELILIQQEIARRRYSRSPVLWIKDRLGEFSWSKQRDILESVRDNRRTAVKSCHGAGKSWLAARLACWWIESHPPGEAFVVTSAPTWKQVRAVLWREIGRAHAKGHLLGRISLKAEWMARMAAGNEEPVAFGLKPADYDPSAFQGIHARWVLVIFDEACGISSMLWNSADSLVSNDESRFLAIGNPDDPKTEFGSICQPGSGWRVIRISAFDTPNFTSESIPDEIRHGLVGKSWVEEKRKKWGETSPYYISKVTGDFPEISEDSLIQMSWVQAAMDRDLPETDPNELGVDVGAGGDKTVIAHRRGKRVRIIHRDQNPDTMRTLGYLMDCLKTTGAGLAKVDYIGVGKGMVDRAKEIARDQGTPVAIRDRAARIVGINVGMAAADPESYQNLRAESYWQLRERFQAEDGIDIEDDDAAAQLTNIKYTRTSHGRIMIESKDDMKRRGLHSPDDADAINLAFLKPPTGPKKQTRATWGRVKKGRK